jgi:DNA-binding MarR family transcriptional regulator
MILNPSSIGDIIPAFAALRNERPESRITRIANRESGIDLAAASRFRNRRVASMTHGLTLSRSKPDSPTAIVWKGRQPGSGSRAHQATSQSPNHIRAQRPSPYCGNVAHKLKRIRHIPGIAAGLVLRTPPPTGVTPGKQTCADHVSNDSFNVLIYKNYWLEYNVFLILSILLIETLPQKFHFLKKTEYSDWLHLSLPEEPQPKPANHTNSTIQKAMVSTQHQQEDEAAQLADFIMFAQRSFMLDLSKELNKGDVSYAQFFLLGHLASEESLTMSNIARKMGHSTAAATGLVDRLEKLGYVQRQHAADDRRKVLVKITRKGQELVNHLRNGIEEGVSRLLSERSSSASEMIQSIRGKA